MFEFLKRGHNTVTIKQRKPVELGFLDELLDDEPKGVRPRTKRQVRKPVVRQKGMRTNSRTIKAQEILDYLKTREGQNTSERAIAKAVGITPTYSHTLVRELMARNTITRSGKRNYYKFRVNRTRVNATRKATKPVVKVVKKASKPRGLKKGPATKVHPVKPHVVDPDDKVGKILRYLTKHQTEHLVQSDIAAGTGVHPATVSRHILQLEKEGRIQRSIPTDEGTLYWVDGGPEVEDKAKKVVEQNNGALYDKMETLMWEFLRTERNTDVVAFMSWVEKQLKED